MESIIDQLRIHDGKLFQNELVLSVYVDFKRLVLNHILLGLSTPGGLKVFLDWDETLEETLVSNLLVTDALFEACLQVFCGELQRVPKTNDLKIMLKSMFAKLCSDSFVVSKQILALDPIKQDFIMREIFRRSLFEMTEGNSPARETEGAEEKGTEEKGAEEIQQAQEIQRPQRETRKEVDLVHKETETLPDTISVLQEKQDTQSVATTASTMTHKKPLIRKVILDDDASTVFTASRR